ncbi:protein FAM207A [Folsomia candida]|uniref:protein FAM207A n=1 Tax=Folsomia candida TaxID=158441 RepID=UPI000B906E47|nr:protein FAM207A [Folsomia candida]
MGKFRVKPARSVAKPFRKSSEFSRANKPTENSESDAHHNKVPSVSLISASKISKRPKPRASALKKTSSASSVQSSFSSPQTSPKKSVTFASPSSNTVHIFGATMTKQDSIRAILKDGASALVNLVSGSVKNLKRKGLIKSERDRYSVAKNAASNSLNKVLKNQFKDKRTRRKLRKEAFHKKLSLLKESEKAIKEEKRRKETVIVGDMQPIADILAELEEEVKMSSAVKPVIVPTPPKKKKMSLKKREQEMLDGLKFFEASGF